MKRRIPQSPEERAARRKFWLELRERVQARDHYRCKECFRERPAVQLQVHHKIERRDGGTDDMNNLVTLCCECHGKKHPWLLKYGYNSAKCLDKVMERKQLKQAIRQSVRIGA
jgi:5-methylcytosine-specific restriction endonuclease McrA